MTYPKWVQRAPDIGPVLCLTPEDEKQLLDDWNGAALKEAEDALAKAQASAAEAKAEATLVLKHIEEDAPLLLKKKK